MRLLPVLLVLVPLACSATTQSSPEPVPSPPSPSAPPSASPRPPATSAAGVPCGDLGCQAFSSVDEAIESVLAERPLVLGIGEAHAQRGTEHLRSTTRRFTEDILPRMKGRATDLIVELMLPSGDCEQKKQEVAARQKPVTEPQAQTNQNEYVTLGHSARKLGIAPDILRPSCADLTAITEAGAEDISVMLATIARLTETKIESLLALNQKDGRDAMILAYGGALHNDLTPRAGRESWSFGPALQKLTQDRYVELDLIVPEYIKDTETWRALPWFAHYDPERHGKHAVVFRVAPKSYVLVFPRSEP